MTPQVARRKCSIVVTCNVVATPMAAWPASQADLLPSPYPSLPIFLACIWFAALIWIPQYFPFLGRFATDTYVLSALLFQLAPHGWKHADSSVLPCTLSCPNMHGNFQSSWYLAGRNVQLHHIILLAMARSTQNQKTLSIHACVEYHLSSLAAPWQAVLWPSSYLSIILCLSVVRSQGLVKLFFTLLQRMLLALTQHSSSNIK